MRNTAIALAALFAAGLAIAGPASAACRDAAGHFAACPAPVRAKAVAVQRCRAANGAFAKCSAPAIAASVAPTGVAANTTAVAPGMVTARCRDGAMSHSQHRSGSCSGHGGVAAWM